VRLLLFLEFTVFLVGLKDNRRGGIRKTKYVKTMFVQR